MKTIKVLIEGTVQGVFFRNFIRDCALAIGVRGYVRNLPDGKVEAIFEGRDDKVMEMLKRAKEGPKHSIIRNVTSEEMRYLALEGFKVLNL